jgi:hypothetical protein
MGKRGEQLGAYLSFVLIQWLVLVTVLVGAGLYTVFSGAYPGAQKSRNAVSPPSRPAQQAEMPAPANRDFDNRFGAWR